MVRRFARPYAKAIMDAAKTPDAADAVRIELQRFDDVRRQSADLREVFANPGIDTDAKIAIANQIAGRLGLGDLTKKILEVLIRNHRMNDLDSIAAALRAYVNAATNTVIAEVRSAHQLGDDELAQLRQTLQKKVGKNVDVQVTTDPSLLGGFVARIGSEIYDASVAGKIEKFRESLV